MATENFLRMASTIGLHPPLRPLWILLLQLQLFLLLLCKRPNWAPRGRGGRIAGAAIPPMRKQTWEEQQQWAAALSAASAMAMATATATSNQKNASKSNHQATSD